jgi:hypothetical protein
MTKYRAIQSFPIPHPNNPKRQVLVRGGDEVELPNDLVGEHAIGVTVERLDDEGNPVAADEQDSGSDSVVELPERPSNGATKVEWRDYLDRLAAVTDPEMDSPLVVPADATRDQMIQIGDQRVNDWNAEG